MRANFFIVLSSLFLFTGCELLQSLKTSKMNTSVLNNKSTCVWEIYLDSDRCEIEYWLTFWCEIEVLKKIFLSQGKSTPFQDRLRAQAWVESILPKLSQQMRRFIVVALYHPSQDLLEMKSALVTLSKINTHQSTHIEEQQALLDKQQNQIDQLLNIEATIIKSIEEDKQ
jgi:hypothetical protein